MSFSLSLIQTEASVSVYHLPSSDLGQTIHSVIMCLKAPRHHHFCYYITQAWHCISLLCWWHSWKYTTDLSRLAKCLIHMVSWMSTNFKQRIFCIILQGSLNCNDEAISWLHFCFCPEFRKLYYQARPVQSLLGVSE